MRVELDPLRSVLEPEAAAFQPLGLEALIGHLGDLATEEAVLLGLDGAREAARREGIDRLARDLMLAREVLGGVAHGAAASGIEQGFPEEVLELDLAHAEAAAMRVGGNGIAAHRFRADAKR